MFHLPVAKSIGLLQPFLERSNLLWYYMMFFVDNIMSGAADSGMCFFLYTIICPDSSRYRLVQVIFHTGRKWTRVKLGMWQL